MVEFNPDGSIKLTPSFEKKQSEIDQKMKSGEYVQIKREVVSEKPPKKCCLQITLSDAFVTNFFVDKIYSMFIQRSNAPSKLKKITEQEFEVEIGTAFTRCSDCNMLIAKFRDFLDGKVIENKGSCLFKEREFCYEDYF